jgi:hypothetical protein
MTSGPVAREQLLPVQSGQSSWAGFEKKSDTFSQHSEMTLMQYPTERENHVKWYTEENMNRFRRNVLRDARRQSSEFMKAKEKNPYAPLPKEELVKYVGLVHLLSDDVIQRSKEAKQARKLHAYNVLKEQYKQRKCRASCYMELARVSALSSLGARERASTVTQLFMMLN